MIKAGKFFVEEAAQTPEKEAALAQAAADSAAAAMLNTKAEGFKKNMAKSKRNH